MMGNRKEEGKFVPFHDPLYRMPSENRLIASLKKASPSLDMNPAHSDRTPSLYHLHHHDFL